MKSAIGIVAPIVKVPHALSASALTTASPRPASAMMTMKRIAMAAVGAGHGADLGARDLGERAAAAAGRGPERDAVVHRAGEADARDEPDEARRVAELRRQHRPDQRPGAGDGGEVMAEQHPPGRGVVVVAVVLRVRRRHARVVEHHDAGGDERAVVAVRDRENAQDRNDQIKGLHERGF